MRLIALIIAVSFLTSCGNKKTANLPPAPSSIESVAKTVSGKKYKSAELALVSTLISDKNNPYLWFDEIKDTTRFFKSYEKQKMNFNVHFINDTSVEISDEGGANKGTWKIDSQPKNDETPGIFSRLTFEKNEAIVPGQVGKSTTTFSYKVLGIDDKQLFVETPNMFNGKKLAILLKSE